MHGEPVLKIARIASHVPLPQYESEGAAGMDLRAFLEEDVAIPPLARVKIPIGLQLEIPDGFEAQVRPRSGLAIRSGITVLNSPGTIDSDYRGDLEVILVNLGSETFIVKNGDRVAQMVVAPVSRARLEETATLSQTVRGNGGFGSTGM